MVTITTPHHLLLHSPPITPLWGTPHKKNFEIRTREKHDIRAKYRAGWSRKQIQEDYKLAQSTIRQVLFYPTSKRIRPGRVGFKPMLSDQEMDEIIMYCAETWDHRILQYREVKEALKLECSVRTLERRLNQRGYHRCIACQKPFLTLAQVRGRLLWAFAHMFWWVEWFHILWSDEMTILIGAKSGKKRVTRSTKEGRYCPNCIQHQLYRPHTIPVSCWGAIGFNYKGPLIIVRGTGKKGAFKQGDYLEQILNYIRPILSAFSFITLLLPIPIQPLFMEDGNPAHGHKSKGNCCARFRAFWGIDLLPHPSISPDMNPIEKCWRWIKHRIHGLKVQPKNKEEMEEALFEAWDAIPQDFINKLILKQHFWVNELVKRKGWSTAN